MIKVTKYKKSVDQMIEGKESFHVYGFSDKLQIVHCLKLGSVTMSGLMENYDNFKNFETYFSEKTIYIIKLRDVHDKWESGYITELMNLTDDRTKMIVSFHEVKSFHDDDEKTNFIKNFFTEIHKIEEDKSFEWTSHHHANINNFGMENTLLYHKDERSLNDEKNVFFIELKDLSNPKFLDWIKNKDSDWNIVKSIPHLHQTPNILKKNLRLFWDENKTDESLFNPYLFEPLQSVISQKQKEVDYIRKYNKRYIKL